MRLIQALHAYSRHLAWPCLFNVYLISSLVVPIVSLWHFAWKGKSRCANAPSGGATRSSPILTGCTRTLTYLIRLFASCSLPIRHLFSILRAQCLESKKICLWILRISQFVFSLTILLLQVPHVTPTWISLFSFVFFFFSRYRQPKHYSSLCNQDSSLQKQNCNNHSHKSLDSH